MPNTYSGRLLSLETVIRIRLTFKRGKKAVYPVVIRATDLSGNKFTFGGFITVEDEEAGIVVGSFNVQ